MKKFFNLQRFAVGKISLTSGADEYENVKASQIIYALGGNDSVRTDIYNNVTIFGGKGADSLDGWRGQKIYLAGDAGNDIIEGTGIKNLTLSGGVGNDSIAAYGSQNVSIVGGAGKDSIYFDPGDVYYKSKNIFISAGIGNDYIQNYGRNDNATIIGGKGNDLINVGEYAKNNLFKYASGDGNDTIFGFDSNDTLEITSGNYSTTTSGTDFIVTVGKQKIILKDAVKDK